MKRDYCQYTWSLGTLSRRLKYFEIKYVDYDVSVEEVEEAVREAQDGPGQLLGYRSLHIKFVTVMAFQCLGGLYTMS